MDNMRHKQGSKGARAMFSKVRFGFRRKTKTSVDGPSNETSVVTEIIAKTPKTKNEKENNGSKQGGITSRTQQASKGDFDETVAIPNIPGSNEIEDDSKACGGLNKGKEAENSTQGKASTKYQEPLNKTSAVMAAGTAIPSPNQENEDKMKTTETFNKESERDGST